MILIDGSIVVERASPDFVGASVSLESILAKAWRPVRQAQGPEPVEGLPLRTIVV
jgi:hypothetical protein